MVDPLSSRGLRLINNGLLLATTVVAGRKLTSDEHTFAFSACMVGGSAAVLGLLRALFSTDGNPDEYRSLREVGQGMLELMPLPLVNMELYTLSRGWGALAFAHGIFVLPLLLDLECTLIKSRKDCELCETLRDLSMLGNIISLTFLSFMERNSLYLRMALTMTVVKYAPLLLDSTQEEAGEDLLVCGSALFFYLLAKVPFWTLQ